MTTSRKPVTPPIPRRTRPLAQPKTEDNPITRDVIQRVKREARRSAGTITLKTIAEETGLAYRSLLEWSTRYGSLPGKDDLMALIRWLSYRDATFIRDVLLTKTPKFIGIIENLRRTE